MRRIGDLSFQDIPQRLSARSILCMPMGSFEQHGPHLPLDTDLVIAEAMTARIVARHGDAFDLWQLPALPIGLSPEHAWAPGTLSLSVAGMTALLRDLGREIARSLPTRNLAIVNGHGGNRGILEGLAREMRIDFALNLCALHLGALMSPVPEAGLPEIHAGCDETSLMLALAPDRVYRDRIARLAPPPDGAAVRALILDPGASFPWSSDDRRIAEAGVIGDARAANAELGEAIAERIVAAAGVVLRQLADNQRA